MAGIERNSTTAPRAQQFLFAAALVCLVLAGGCAQSAAKGWAQTSAIIAPSKRPASLSLFSAVDDEQDEQVQ